MFRSNDLPGGAYTVVIFLGLSLLFAVSGINLESPTIDFRSPGTRLFENDEKHYVVTRRPTSFRNTSSNGSPLLSPNKDVAIPPALAASSIDTLRSVSGYAFEFTNRERSDKNLNQLETEDRLWQIACRYSHDMLERDFFQHKDPDGNGPSDRVAKQHRSLIGEAGENLWGQSGRGDSSPEALGEKMVKGWMNSPPHRENILRPQFTHMSVCVLKEGTTWRGTQMFARIRAYLADPLPQTATAGSRIVAPIRQTFHPSDSVAMYDLWNPETRERIVGPTPFSDTLDLPQTTGPVRTRFYIPESDQQYSIHMGPEIRITPQ